MFRLTIVLLAASLASAAVSAEFTVFPCGADSCAATAIATDSSHATYVAGNRASGSHTHAFVTKIDATGSMAFLVNLAWNGEDRALAVAVDSNGAIYVAGSTSSSDFPVKNAAQSSPGPGTNGFVVKLSADGGKMLYATYFGGTTRPGGGLFFTVVNGIAVDASGAMYITGDSNSPNFPTLGGLPAYAVGDGFEGRTGAFISKLSANGDKLLYSGIIAGDAVACSCCSSCFLSHRFASGKAITIDADGNAYVAGNSNVTDLPTTDGAYRKAGIGAWVARVPASGAKLDYFTYLGSSYYVLAPGEPSDTIATGLAVDSAGNAYVSGYTSNPDFPATPGAFQTAIHLPQSFFYFGFPPSDGFVVKLNAQGTGLVYSTFIGGTGWDAAQGVAVDSTGAAYVVGTSDSSDFFVTSSATTGGDFLAVLNPAGSAASYSTRFPSSTVSAGIVVTADGHVAVASSAGSASSMALSHASPWLLGLGNAATSNADSAVAPGEMVTLFGDQLFAAPGSTLLKPGVTQLPVSLSGMQVLFDGVAVPLVSVSPGQVTAMAPLALVPGQNTKVRVTAPSSLFAAGSSNEIVYAVVKAQPAVFLAADGSAASNQDGTRNSLLNPAVAGTVAAVWVTGVGPLTPGLPGAPVLVDGHIATEVEALNPSCCTVLSSDVPVEILYIGAAPGLPAGVVQVNFRVPPITWDGDWVYVQVGSSPKVPVYVKR